MGEDGQRNVCRGRVEQIGIVLGRLLPLLLAMRAQSRVNTARWVTRHPKIAVARRLASRRVGKPRVRRLWPLPHFLIRRITAHPKMVGRRELCPDGLAGQMSIDSRRYPIPGETGNRASDEGWTPTPTHN